MEIYTGGIAGEEPNANQDDVGCDNATMEGGPPAHLKRGPQLVGKEQRGHGENEYVSRNIMTPP